MFKGSLTSEWFGYSANRFYPPKSFYDTDSGDWDLAFKALFYLVGALDSSKNIKRLDASSISGNSKKFMEYIVLSAVVSTARKLGEVLPVDYKQERKLTGAIRGRVNFSETFKYVAGDKSRFVCEYPRLRHSSYIFDVIYFGLKFAKPLIYSSLNDENRKVFERSFSEILSHIPADDVEEEGVSSYCNLILSGVCNDEHFDLLKEELYVFSYLLTSGRVGYALGKAHEFPGIALNLNRPFEKLINKSLTASGYYSNDVQEVNSIKLRLDDELWDSSFQMKPDCKGYLSINNINFYLIADVKHKIFNNAIDDDSYDSINRNDLYQVISYANTLSARAVDFDFKKILLVGLSKEPEVSGTLVEKLPTISINFNESPVEVERVAVRFGSALVALGSVLNCKSDIGDFYKTLGKKLIESLNY